jgi:hypothetical protein
MIQINHCLIALLAAFAARAEMIHGDAVRNDPVNERLCIERTQGSSDYKGATLVPFEIDKDYVDRSRSPRFGGNPGVTFIAIENASGVDLLIQCDVLGGVGKYGPVWVRDENSTPSLWRLPNKPEQFSPSIHTLAGRSIATVRCIDAAVAKVNRPNYDHSINSEIAEVGPATTTSSNPAGSLIAGAKPERYDVIIRVTAMYKSAGPDMDTVQFVCLFSPLLKVKAIQIK